MDAKTLELAVKKGVEAAQKQQASGVSEAEQKEIDLLKATFGMSPASWEEQAAYLDYLEQQKNMPKFNDS